jgi:alanine racemase
MTAATLTIDLSAITANWRALDGMSGADVQTGAVVKADGYGLGVAKISRALADAGVTRFFVAVAQEGAELRQTLGPGPEINLFSGHMDGDTDLIRDARLTPMLNSPAQLTRHLAALPDHPFGVQLDTGMNRLGMQPSDWQDVRNTALTAGPSLLMSHLACADTPDHPMNAAQLAQFHEMTDGTDVPRSLVATAGMLLGADYHFDLTRPGIGIYGGWPFTDATPVVRISIPLIQVRDLSAGESVGYANAWVAKKPSRIATLSGGYADGFLRSLGNGAALFHGATPCPLVGRVSMDLLTVDITHLPEPPESLDLLCGHQSIDDLAKAAGTIGHEVLTSLGPRYRRRYKGGR